jgi:predicted metal-dependent hydrolase
MASNELGYTVAYRDVKHPRLEFKTGSLLVVLPKGKEKPQQTLEKYRGWINRKRQIIDAALKEAPSKNLTTERNENQLKLLVTQLAQNAEASLHVTVNEVRFRKMRTKWASHSKNNNLTVNTMLKYLPAGLIEYVIFHEVAHNIEKKHNSYFWVLIAKRFPDYETKEKDLLTYWFIVQKHVGSCHP